MFRAQIGIDPVADHVDPCTGSNRKLLDDILRLQEDYFNSTSAPASVSCFLRFSASSLGKPSLIVLGAPSTNL